MSSRYFKEFILIKEHEWATCLNRKVSGSSGSYVYSILEPMTKELHIL